MNGGTRWILAAFAIAVIGLAIVLAGRGRARIESLTFAGFQEAFHDGADSTRLLVMLSPT